MSLFFKLYKLVSNQNKKVSLQHSNVLNSAQKIFKVLSLNQRNKRACQIEASPFAANLTGSMTVEAAMSGWIFMMAVLSVISIIQVVSTYNAVWQILVDTGKQVAVTASDDHDATGRIQIYTTFFGRVDELGNQGIEDGVENISLLGSRVDAATGDIKINVYYAVQPRLLCVPGIRIPMSSTVNMKAWTGYHKNQGSSHGDSENSQTYYLTENESVYHTSAQCTHLQLSISMTDTSLVDTLRNQNGERYSACERCNSIHSVGTVYVTGQGNKYHTSLECSGIKRTVHDTGDIGHLKACSRCGGGSS